MEYLLLYLLLINAAGCLLMLLDKLRARKKRWRIPEAALMGVALCGGSVGVLLGMYLFRHKTRHIKFSIGVPVIFAVQAVAGILLFLHLG